MSEHEEKLRCLHPAPGSHYRSGEEYMCLKETRTGLLEKIMDFIRQTGIVTLETSTAHLKSMPKLFWLFGFAGSGKSTVANTITAYIEETEDFDLTCFFCKRDDTTLNNPRRFFPTLAYRMSQYYPSYKSADKKVSCVGRVPALVC